MPSRRTALDTFRRDGGCCRFRGIRIRSRDAIRLLDSLFPEQLRRKAKPCRNRKAAFFVLASSFDHILPHSRGVGTKGKTWSRPAGAASSGACDLRWKRWASSIPDRDHRSWIGGVGWNVCCPTTGADRPAVPLFKWTDGCERA
jgi:hypothetical protein